MIRFNSITLNYGSPRKITLNEVYVRSSRKYCIYLLRISGLPKLLRCGNYGILLTLEFKGYGRIGGKCPKLRSSGVRVALDVSFGARKEYLARMIRALKGTMCRKMSTN